MSGIELKRHLAISGVVLPMIFISGDDSDVTRKAALEAGCVAYLLKPLPAKLLMDAIEKALARPCEPAEIAQRDPSAAMFRHLACYVKARYTDLRHRAQVAAALGYKAALGPCAERSVKGILRVRSCVA
jgi:FixJ family two-component response regulator